MAKVTLQVVVNDTQVNKLQERINSLNNTKVTIGVQDFTKNLKDAGAQVDNMNGKLTKTVRVFNKDGELVKGVDNYRTTAKQAVQITHKLNEETGSLEQTSAKVTETVKKQGLMYDILGRSLTSFLARMAAYRAVYAGIRAITNGINEALQTMKALDDELVTVRKVTGFSAEQMAQVQASAYSVASKYGVNAADYASGVAAFARAGYKEASGELAELAQKTMIVGDTTAEVANQFLLSVDAAYKYSGSIEALSKVLDGANELDNKYATSIEKIAEGMGIVAPVAAQMHVGIDELAASIGTITAVTQRSGSETARALRALYLNIVGDTKTEIEEGVTWTTGEIEGLRDVIKLYAKDAYEAAQATGGIIDPMKAMEGLAKSLKDGVLTEAQLMEMVSDIGGKLRTSQLLALINNWDMYESMLNDYRNAYGSADKEIENAMDSWTRKTAVLKNTWTEFIQSSFRTSFFKGIIDGLTSIIEHLDSFPAVFTRLGIAFIGLKLPSIVEGFRNAKDAVKGFFTELVAGETAASSAAGIIGVVAAAVMALLSAYSAYSQELKIQLKEELEAQEERRKKSIEEMHVADERIKKLQELRQEYLEIINSTADEAQKDELLVQWKNKLGEAYGVEKAALEGVNQERKTGLGLIDEQIRRETTLAYSKGIDEFTRAQNWLNATPSSTNVGTFDASKVNDNGLYLAAQQYGFGLFMDRKVGYGEVTTSNMTHEQTIAQITDTINALLVKKATAEGLTKGEAQLLSILQGKVESLTTEYNKYKDVVEAFIPVQARFNFLSDERISKEAEQIESYSDYMRVRGIIARQYAGENELMQQMLDILAEMYPQYANATEGSKEYTEALNLENKAIGENERALGKDATAAERAAAAKKDAEASVRKLIPALRDENGQLTAAAKAAFQMDSNLAGMVKSELEAQAAAKSANYSNLIAQIAAVGGMAAYARLQVEAMGQLTGNPLIDGVKTAAMSAKIAAQLAMMKVEMQSITNMAGAVGVYVPSTGSGSGSSSGSGSGSGSSSASSTDTRLKSLQDRVSLLKSELSLMKERGDSEESQIAKMREIQKAIKAEEDYLKSINGSQIDINKLEEEWWSYQNRILESTEQTANANEKNAQAIQAAVDAQIALNNALKERNVHVFNSETGQWEWQANPTAVSSARNALISAAQNLPDGIRENFMREYGINLPSSSTVSNVGGTSNYGNTYNFGNFTLTEEQAKSMSVYELARLSAALGAYNNSP